MSRLNLASGFNWNKDPDDPNTGGGPWQPPPPGTPPPGAPPPGGAPVPGGFGDEGHGVITPGSGGGGSGAPGVNDIWGRLRGAPMFDAPDFEAPNLSDDPSYAFRLAGGREALERSAAARGTLRTGGSLRDLLEYGQNFASQEYNNAFGRALQGWNARFQGAQSEFAPRMAEWNAGADMDRARAMAEYNRWYGGGGGGGGWDDIPPPPA